MGTNSILIIANIRCGGTYLMKSLAFTYNLKEVWEPEILQYFNTPTVVKVNATMHSAKALIEYSNYFSKIILLDRKDKKAQLESAVHMFTNNGVIDVKWEWEEGSYSKLVFKKSRERIKLHSTRLQELSNRLGEPINYYEDIYSSGKKLIGLDFKPNLSKKLRVLPKKKTLN